MADSVESSVFKWDSLREICPHSLTYQKPIDGVMLEVELTSGHKIRVFRSLDRAFYFCHGLTFGGKEAPDGPISPFSGTDIWVLLENYYFLVTPNSLAQQGDILVWKGLGKETPHSAILTTAVVLPGSNDLDYSSLLRSKNGKLPEATLTLETLTYGPGSYGETYSVYRRK